MYIYIADPINSSYKILLTLSIPWLNLMSFYLASTLLLRKNILLYWTNIFYKYIKVYIYITNPLKNSCKMMLTLSMLWINLLFLCLDSALLLKNITFLYFNLNLLLHKLRYLYVILEMLLHNTMFLYFYKFKLCNKTNYLIRYLTKYIFCKIYTTKTHHYYNYHSPDAYKITYLINVISKSYSSYNIPNQTSKNE